MLQRLAQSTPAVKGGDRNQVNMVVDATLQATGKKITRLTKNHIFLEVRAINPLVNDKRPFLPSRESLVYEAARS